MSKNSQDKYYEIGVMRGKSLIAEYVTTLPIIKGEGLVHEKLMNLMYKKHGKDIIVLWNKKEGKLPNDNRQKIKIRIPIGPTLKYNR